MSYKHYGNIGDIWKHLPLSSFLVNEKPRKYIETNSANPFYQLTHSPRRDFGVYTFFSHVKEFPILNNTPYVKVIQSLDENREKLKAYLGSPGLAISLLGPNCQKYIFYDIEKSPLMKIQDYSENLNLISKVETRCEDSIIGSWKLIEQLNSDDFIHFDPYSAFKKGKNDIAYIDVFLKATKCNVPSMLWYAYFTLKEKRNIAKILQNLFRIHQIKVKKKKIKNIEIYLDIIEEEKITVNPGVLGCGVLVSNLSDKSLREFDIMSKELVKLYKGTMIFDGFPGDLKRAVVF